MYLVNLVYQWPNSAYEGFSAISSINSSFAENKIKADVQVKSNLFGIPYSHENFISEAEYKKLSKDVKDKIKQDWASYNLV